MLMIMSVSAMACIFNSNILLLVGRSKLGLPTQ
jgi:hypothetical protein